MIATLRQNIEKAFNLTGTARRDYFKAIKVRRTGCAELNAQVERGNIPVDLALKVAQFDHMGQRLVLAEFTGMKPQDRAGFVKRLKSAIKQGAA